MKKIFSIVLLSTTIAASAQISFAVKANALIPTSSATWQNFKAAASNTVSQKGKNITGFNAGLSMKIDLPTALYVMPEIYYSNFKNEVTIDDVMTGGEATIEAKSSRVDVPVLLGVNVLGDLLSAYAGPVASFNLVKDEEFRTFVQSVNSKEFTVGYQIGAQSEIKKLIISARYEGAFSKDQRKFISTAVDATPQEITYDNRSSLFLLGLGYKF